MLPQEMRIEKINSVLFGNKPFPAGAVRDWTCRRDYCELIMIVSGTRRITWKNETFTETGGSVRFMPESGEGDRYISEIIEPGDYCIVTFNACGAPDEMLHSQLKFSAGAEQLFLRLWRTWTLKQNGWYHRSVGILYEILAELEGQRYYPNDRMDVLAPAMAEIERSLTSGVDVSHLHELCGISYSYFKRLFIGRYGIPPRRYITKLRMNIAYEQLASGNLSVSEIAAILGFSDISYFSRVFRKETGCTAEEYRRARLRKQGEYREP